MEENRTTVSSLKVCERHIQLLQKEKEQLKTENGKSLLARSRLEELCRELQRQNKVVKGADFFFTAIIKWSCCIFLLNFRGEHS